MQGRIIEIKGELGKTVKQGDVLAVINSTELAKQQLAYIKSVQMVELKTKAYERAVLLFDADVVSEAQKLQRKTELSAAKADMEASKDQLSVMGMTVAQKLKLFNLKRKLMQQQISLLRLMEKLLRKM